MTRHITDPVEKVVAMALNQRGVPYVHESEGGTHGLDFHLPDHGVFIECKRFHAPRIARQMGRVEHIIVLQGMEAARLFALLITSFGPVTIDTTENPQ